MQIPQILQTISKVLASRGAKAIVVGGSVRDFYLNLPIKDYDIEVYGLESLESLENILLKYGNVNLVGKSFGIVKFTHNGKVYDFSFPRRESKNGIGHRGFSVSIDSKMDFETASRRRDFTINAMGYDIEKKIFLDPFNGVRDIERKLLLHVDNETFIDDPLRVYRAIQFCARFEYRLADKTFLLCRDIVKSGELETLAKERIFEEFKKLLLNSPKPSIGFEVMRELGVLNYFKELEAITTSDAWVHTMISLDSMANLLGSDKKQNLTYMFAILCRNLAKSRVTRVDKKHEEIDLEPTKSFMNHLTDERQFIEKILSLVENHLKPSQFFRDKSSDKAIRKLATKVNIEELLIVAEADFLAKEWLYLKAKNLKVEQKPLPNLLQGRDLISLGFTPSPKFKEILDTIYNLLLDGKISTKEEAMRVAKGLK